MKDFYFFYFAFEKMFEESKTELYKQTYLSEKENSLRLDDVHTFNRLILKLERRLFGLIPPDLEGDSKVTIRLLARAYLAKFVLLADFFEDFKK
jgi:hypothetical protein